MKNILVFTILVASQWKNDHYESVNIVNPLYLIMVK